MSGRILEFAFTTMFITIAHLAFAYFVAYAVSTEISGSFEQVNVVLDPTLRTCYYNR